MREVSSLKSMVDEFSRFARLPATKLETGDVNEIVTQAVKVFDGRFSSRVIDLELAGTLPVAALDPEQLKRVFVNLIENAVEAFEPEQKEHRITITTRHYLPRSLTVAAVYRA